MKPDGGKILLFLLIVIASFITGFLGTCFGGNGPCYFFPWSYISYALSSISIIFSVTGFEFLYRENLLLYDIVIFLGLALNAIYWYIIACFSIWVYRNRKK